MLVTLQSRRQRRQYRFESFATNPICGFPQHDKSFTHRTVIQMVPNVLWALIE
jgi:hypothetical protein